MFGPFPGMCAIEAAPKRQPRFFGLYGLREKPGGLAYLAGAGRGARVREDALDYRGVAIFGDRKKIARLTGSLPLLR